MGLFDKLKASVGVGGAKIELAVQPVVFGSAKVPVKISILGGKLDQQLNKIDLAVEVEGEAPAPAGSQQTGPVRKTVEVWKGHIDTTSKKTIAKDSQNHFESAVEIPSFDQIYGAQLQAELFIEISDDDNDPMRWKGPEDEMLPAIENLEEKIIRVRASADIPGAIDPSAVCRVHVLPPVEGALRRAGRVPADALHAALERAGAHRVFPIMKDDYWFVFWTNRAGRVVAHANMRAVASLRPDGVVRTYTNPAVPASCVIGKQASEKNDRIQGGAKEARAWAEELAREAKVDGIIYRPVGNTFFALENLQIAG